MHHLRPSKRHYIARAHEVSKKPREESVELICGIATTAIPANSHIAAVPNRSSRVVQSECVAETLLDTVSSQACLGSETQPASDSVAAMAAKRVGAGPVAGVDMDLDDDPREDPIQQLLKICKSTNRSLTAMPKDPARVETIAVDAKTTAEMAVEAAERAIAIALSGSAASAVSGSGSTAASAGARRPTKFVAKSVEVKGFAIYRNKLPTDESCLTDKEAAEWVEKLHNLLEASARDLVNWDSAKSRCSKAALATKIILPLKNEYHQDQRHAWDLRSAVMQAVEEHVELRKSQGIGKITCSLENDPARWAYSTAGGHV